ncbi:PPE domain-containing protein [Mycobacterium sp. Aquia_213]|uniref:PPE domain-containing protein n=1 Tax=Mycobacterium sp. Aquia_213 TaxID=2991728 RepID=UPI0022714762|nr:hypothetical protein [Mycobacterium sp. Aquia_213]WAC90337.1 hypothetical protein LMQ14_20780 [Mycobacterium sp. Aquia_213]
MARAAELEQPLPTIPAINPAPPCALSYTKDAATQIALSADAIRLYLKGCAREWKSLAKSLRDAAKAYQEVDEGGADAINTEGSMSNLTPASASGSGPDEDWSFNPPAPIPMSAPFDYPYYAVRQAVMDIENGDQGAAFHAFAHEWTTFQLALQQEAYRFRPFLDWEGDARAAVESNFEQQRQWIFGMVQLCCKLGEQALTVVDAQKKLRAANGSYYHNPNGDSDISYIPGEHPGPFDISNCDYWYKWYVENAPQDVHYAVEWYQVLQDKSEEALKIYVDNAQLPLPPVNPSMFPTVVGIADFGAGSGDLDLGDLTDGLNSGDGLSGLPAMPSLPTGGTPATPDSSALNGAAVPPLPAAGKGLPKGAPVKPASFGGGGGGAAVPKLPLQAWTNTGAAAGAAAAAPAAAGAGIQVPAGYAKLNGAGGGMGGMPMGGQGGQGQGAGKGKRVPSEDGALYTEDRAWTEGVIGRRRAEGSPARG